MTSGSSAQRLVDEFEEAATDWESGKYNIRHGIAAKQFLHEAGFTDKQGQWLPQYQPIPEAND